MSDIWIVFGIVAGVVVLFIWDRLPVVIVCLGCALSLWATGVIDLQQSLAGFGDPATVFIAALFIASAALEKTGVTARVGQVLIAGAGESRWRLISLMMLFVGLLTAVISVNGAVAALLPVVVVLAVRLRYPPSQLLMPMVFGAHAGSLLALTGTPVNVLVAEAAVDASAEGFSYFEFSLVGIPMVIGTIVLAILLGKRLLPHRESRALPPDLSRYARTLVEDFRLETDLHQLRIRAGSPLVGRLRTGVDLSGRDLTLITVRAGTGETAARLGALEVGDVLLVRGAPDLAAALALEMGLSLRDPVDSGPLEQSIFNRASGLAEVMVPPRSPIIGQRLFPGMVTPSGDLVILAVERRDEPLAVGETLAAGDVLLLQGSWDALDEHLSPPEVLTVNSPDIVRRQALAMGPGSKATLVILGVMVVLLATAVVPAAVAGLLAAGALVVMRILSVDECYRAINWTTVILVGAMMPLSTAITETGAAKLLASQLVLAVGGYGPTALLAGLFLLTAILGQVISNVATALIIIPVSVVAAKEMGLSPDPVLMTVNIAAASSFLTPVATPTNLLVMEPAGYRFGDYWKFGAPMMLWFFIVAMVLVPLIWPL